MPHRKQNFRGRMMSGFNRTPLSTIPSGCWRHFPVRCQPALRLVGYWISQSICPPPLQCCFSSKFSNCLLVVLEHQVHQLIWGISDILCFWQKNTCCVIITCCWREWYSYQPVAAVILGCHSGGDLLDLLCMTQPESPLAHCPWTFILNNLQLLYLLRLL